MPSSTLSTVTGLAIVGAGLGLYLGQSAISEINPAHYGGAAARFHADAVAAPPSLGGTDLSAVRASAELGYPSACVGCRAYPEEYVPIYDPAVESYGSTYSAPPAAPVEAVLAEADRYVAQGPTRVELDRVQRYAHYEVAAVEDADKAALTAAVSAAEEVEAAADAETETAPAS